MPFHEIERADSLKSALIEQHSITTPAPLSGEHALEAYFATFSPARLLVININRFIKRDEQSIPERYQLSGTIDIADPAIGEELANMLLVMPSDIRSRDGKIVVLSPQTKNDDNYWKIFYSTDPSFRRHVMVHIEGSKTQPKATHVIFVEEEGTVRMDVFPNDEDRKIPGLSYEMVSKASRELKD